MSATAQDIARWIQEYAATGSHLSNCLDLDSCCLSAEPGSSEIEELAGFLAMKIAG